MPYEITKKGPNHILSNKATGRVLGVHKTREDAMSQMRAVGMHEGETRRNLKSVTSVYQNGQPEKPRRVTKQPIVPKK